MVQADTETGEFTCSVNGVNLDNLVSVNLYKSCDYYSDAPKTCVRFSAESSNTVDKVRTSVYAQDLSQDTAKAELTAGNAKFLDENKTIASWSRNTTVSDSIRNWLKKS